MTLEITTLRGNDGGPECIDAPPVTGGCLIAFDGTWIDSAKNSVIYRFFRDRYAGTAKRYYPGIGVGSGPFRRLVSATFGLGATAIVRKAWHDLAEFYGVEAHREMPVDVIGYSRGAFQAVRLAHRLMRFGLPGFDAFRPRVRFVGLVSPVGQMGAVFTRFDPGWAKTLPGGVGYAFQTLGSNPDHRLFLETSLDLSAATRSACPPRSHHSHAAIGWAGDVLNDLADHARQAGAPVVGSREKTS